jgi:hypothetical protein
MNGTQSVNVTQHDSWPLNKPQNAYPARVSHDGVNLDGCTGSFADVTFKAATVPCATASGKAIKDGDINGCGKLNEELTTSGGLTAKIVRTADSTTLAWSNGQNWTKPCADFSGTWCIHPVTAPNCGYHWEQNADGASLGGFPAGCVVQGFAKGYIKGNKIDSDYHGLKAFIEMADSKTPGLDRLVWQDTPDGNVTWYRYQNWSLPPPGHA